jgi:hypothetical protein
LFSLKRHEASLRLQQAVQDNRHAGPRSGGKRIAYNADTPMRLHCNSTCRNRDDGNQEISSKHHQGAMVRQQDTQLEEESPRRAKRCWADAVLLQSLCRSPIRAKGLSQAWE